jgi:hypothetical protein
LDINLFYTSTKKGTMFFLRGEQDVAKWELNFDIMKNFQRK